MMSCLSLSGSDISIAAGRAPLPTGVEEGAARSQNLARGAVEVLVGTTVAAILATVVSPFVDNPVNSLAGSPLPPTLVEGARKATPPPSLEVASPHLPDSDRPVGGCLQHSWRQWQTISHDRWVTEVIHRGYELDFVSQPPLTPPIPLP